MFRRRACGLPSRNYFDTIFGVSPSTAAVASSPKLLDRVRWYLRVRHYSIRTEQAYVDWIRHYILFHRKRHPNEMGEQEITEFLTHLAVEKRVAASTQNQAFAALLFLYQQVLGRKLDFIGNVERVKRPAKLPVVFTPAEARAVLAHLKGDYRLMAELLYGSGLRLMECLRLRIKDIDFGYNRITVRDAKGLRDRVTLLPQRLQRPLRGQIARVEELHRQDIARGSGKVYLPFALERKYPKCCARIHLAISLSSGKTFARSPLPGNTATPCFREKSPKRCETCHSSRRA
jgi:integron integrase